MDERPMEIPYPRRTKKERPIPHIYAALDNDLARGNLENDLPGADFADLEQSSPGAGGEDF